jgi:hypothetical protein
MSPEEQSVYVWNILAQHKDKNFVRRIISPQNYPMLHDYDSGQFQTHLMADNEEDGIHNVFPTIVQLGDGSLKKFSSSKQAWDYAKKTGEFISFDNQKDAGWFARNYKKVWGGWQPGFAEQVHMQL